MMWVIECHYPGSPTVRHRCAGELTNAEILKRFGLRSSRYRVTIWPDGRPHEARTIHEKENTE